MKYVIGNDLIYCV